MGEKDQVLWEQSDPHDSIARLVMTRQDRLTPEYELVVDPGDGTYGYPVVLERAHLASLWLAILEQADSLEWASKAINHEAAIRAVMKIREVSRDEALALMEKL